MVQKRFKKKKNKQTKVNLIFDEQARESFLTGFKKRKDERRKRARKQLEQQFKEEKRRIRQKEKDKMLMRIRSQLPLEETDEVLESRTYELPNHTVCITEVAEVDLAQDDGTRLGTNKGGDFTEQDVSVDYNGNNRPEDAQRRGSQCVEVNEHHTRPTSKNRRRKQLINPFEPKKRCRGGQQKLHTGNSKKQHTGKQRRHRTKS